jgi:hypothetical protein
MTCLLSGHGDCRGRTQLHHIVPRQRIRRQHAGIVAEYRRTGQPQPWGLMKALGDDRNLVELCVYHHGEVEQRRLYVTPPESAREFAREYGLEWSLEADEVRSSGEAA